MSYTLEMEQQLANVPEERKRRYDRQKTVLRNLVDVFYDQQGIRIRLGNKIVASFNIQTGQAPSKKKSTIDKEMQKIIDKYENEYRLITDMYVGQSAEIQKVIHDRAVMGKDGQFQQLEYIRCLGDYTLMEAYEDSKKKEASMLEAINVELQGIPIYEQYLKNEKGIGPTMAAVIIAYYDIYKAKYVSSMLKYTGIDTVEDPEHPEKRVGRTKGHTVMKEYTTKEGEKKMKKSITYNPVVKTKMLGVLADLFIKLSTRWSIPYYEYLNRINVRPDTKDYPYKRKAMMAKRYMMKQFIKELFVKWKEIEGLPIPLSYEEEYLHMLPHKWEMDFETYMYQHPDMFEDRIKRREEKEKEKAAKKAEKERLKAAGK